jgi:hypothetical protein
MLTFFTTAKPFRGHNGVIQRNALRSWTLLHPNVEVILFGEDEGTVGTAGELGIRHEPYTEKNESGSNRLDYMFLRAQEIARHEVLCYSNCDILLMQDFWRESVSDERRSGFTQPGGTPDGHARGTSLQHSGVAVQSWTCDRLAGDSRVPETMDQGSGADLR